MGIEVVEHLKLRETLPLTSMRFSNQMHVRCCDLYCCAVTMRTQRPRRTNHRDKTYRVIKWLPSQDREPWAAESHLPPFAPGMGLSWMDTCDIL